MSSLSNLLCLKFSFYFNNIFIRKYIFKPSRSSMTIPSHSFLQTQKQHCMKAMELEPIKKIEIHIKVTFNVIRTTDGLGDDSAQVLACKLDRSWALTQKPSAAVHTWIPGIRSTDIGGSLRLCGHPVSLLRERCEKHGGMTREMAQQVDTDAQAWKTQFNFQMHTVEEKHWHLPVVLLTHTNHGLHMHTQRTQNTRMHTCLQTQS